MDNCLATELFMENSVFSEVSRVAGILRQNGIRTFMLPPDERGINVHLVVETPDVPKSREILRKHGISAMEREIVVVRMADIPGTMAHTTKKLAAAGVNINYAFSAATTHGVCYALFSTSDNRKALAAVCAVSSA